MLYKFIWLLLLFLFSCQKESNKEVFKDAQHKKNVQVENKFYNKVSISCKDSEGLVYFCHYRDFQVHLDYNARPNSIIFNLNKKKYSYQLDSVFEGIGSEILLYRKNSDQILIVELLYEYSSRLLLFQINNDNLYFLKNIEFNIPDGKYNYQVEEIKSGIAILLNNSNLTEKKEIKFSEKKKINDLDKYLSELEKWNGTYKCTIEVVRDMNEHTSEYSFYIKDKKAVLIKTSEGKEEKVYLSVTRISKSALSLKSDNEEDYIIKKNNGNYYLAGNSVYLLNPPNENYILKKSYNN